MGNLQKTCFAWDIQDGILATEFEPQRYKELEALKKDFM